MVVLYEFIDAYWMPALYSALGVFVTFIGNKLWHSTTTMLAKQTQYEKAILAIMYDRIFQACQYHLKEKSISTPELKNLEHLYENYHNLGGNGTGTELYKRCLDLPLKESR